MARKPWETPVEYNDDRFGDDEPNEQAPGNVYDDVDSALEDEDDDMDDTVAFDDGDDDMDALDDDFESLDDEPMSYDRGQDNDGFGDDDDDDEESED